MKREILDSNIYGKIIENNDIDFVLECLPHSNILIYGADVIRKELRDTPKEKIMVSENKKIKIRLMLLNVYDYDFLIVAVAALNNLEVVYSEDNTIKKLKTPRFKSYEEFKNELSKK